MCALFSSVAALFLGEGQANYSAANSCLDALAACRRAHGQTAVSVQWGAWAEVGMASRGTANERVAAMEEASGFGRVTLSRGLDALQGAVRPCGPSVLGVVPVVWSKMLGGGITAPFLLSTFSPVACAVDEPVLSLLEHGSSPMPQRHIPAPVAAMPAVTLEDVLALVRKTAKVAETDAPLLETGVDSLGAIELRNNVQKAVAGQISVPSTLVFDHPTARAIAEFVASEQARCCPVQASPAAPTPVAFAQANPAVPPCPSMRRVTLADVLALVAKTAKVSETDAPLTESGVDSLGAVELRNNVQKAVGKGLAIPSTLVFDHPTAREIAAFIAEGLPEQQPQAASAPASTPQLLTPSDVLEKAMTRLTVDGHALCLPEGVVAEVYAASLAGSGANVISEVPLARWDSSGVQKLGPAIVSRCRHGGFVCNADFFDNEAFRVTAAEAAATDPQQRSILEHGYEAFLDAKSDRGVLLGSLAAVFIGISIVDFEEVMRSSPLGGSVYAAIGSNTSVASGRLSFVLVCTPPLDISRDQTSLIA